jgi:hypothetical protein
MAAELRLFLSSFRAGHARDDQQSAGAPRRFVAHLYQARKQYRLVCERPNKRNKAIEREVISSFQVSQSLGFQGDFRAWEHLLRIHD